MINSREIVDNIEGKFQQRKSSPLAQFLIRQATGSKQEVKKKKEKQREKDYLLK